MGNDDIEFIKNTNENAKEKQNEFTVLLNGQKDLEDQLQNFKKLCETHDKHQRKRTKRRYYNLALMAKVEKSTTPEEIKHLLNNNTRTFLVDVVTHKVHEVEALTKMIRQAEEEQQSQEPKIKLTIGLALQITGDVCRVGRFRNNSSLLLSRGNTITLTTDIAYRYTCFKEIAYVLNLHHYLPYIQLNDEISIGHDAKGLVVKKLKTAIAVRIEEIGLVNSYDLIDLPNQCYALPSSVLKNIFYRDLEMAEKLGADFIALPYVRCVAFLKLLQQEIASTNKFKLIGNIDLEYISKKMLDLVSIIKPLNYLWLTNLFSNNQNLNNYLMQDVIPVAKCLKKPLIGSVPLERCNDFKLFENHAFLWKVDCMFIEKSGWCNKYPLIVKKLLPIKNYRLAAVDNPATMHDILSNSQSIINFIIRTISSIECQAIFLHAKCETAAKALSRVEIYCPVYVMLELEDISQDIENNNSRLIELSKNFNLRRNLKPVLYTKQMNVCEYKPIDYGIEYARQRGCIETGDFIITLDVGKEDGEDHVQLGVGEDMVLMRAIYVPPMSFGEKFICQ